ncbi:hypothetical protein Leryth_006614 [Lithospermum erythrorhizon]|nr:hypothetical protein Leryth_006614 [Lithospermum erythrorhizon]
MEKEVRGGVEERNGVMLVWCDGRMKLLNDFGLQHRGISRSKVRGGETSVTGSNYGNIGMSWLLERVTTVGNMRLGKEFG